MSVFLLGFREFFDWNGKTFFGLIEEELVLGISLLSKDGGVFVLMVFRFVLG